MKTTRSTFRAAAVAVSVVVIAAILMYNIYSSPAGSAGNLPLSERESVLEVLHLEAGELEEAALVTFTREPAAAEAHKGDAALPEVAPEPAELPTKRILVSDPVLAKNIKARQSAIRQHLDVVENPHASERELVGAFIGMAGLSVLTMYDIEGRSRVIPEMLVDLEAAHTDPYRHYVKQTKWTSNDPEIYRIVSGGATYEIPRGEFPEFDRIDAARKAFGDNSVPIGELAIAEILARANLVLSHQVD